jgi:hypothetical protein
MSLSLAIRLTVGMTLTPGPGCPEALRRVEVSGE